MPRRDQLPDSLRGLCRRNAFELSDKRWAADMERLAKVIGQIPVTEPEPEREPAASRRPEPRRHTDETAFPRIITKRWLLDNVPNLTGPQLSTLVDELAHRGWSEDKIADCALLAAEDLGRLSEALSLQKWSQTDVEELLQCLDEDDHAATDESSRKQPVRIDFVAALRFIETIPTGHWSSYGDVARAAGSPQGAQSIGNWLRVRGEEVPHVWRVLDRDGEVSGGWVPANTTLPATREAVRQRLQEEGVRLDSRGRADQSQRWTNKEAATPDRVSARKALPATARADTVIVAGRTAYPDYLLSSCYVCQPGRAFRGDPTHLGFYFDREIKPEIARIVHRRDHVRFDVSVASSWRRAATSGTTESAP